MNIIDIIDLIDTDNLSHYKTESKILDLYSRPIQMRAVLRNGNNIRLITNPSIALRLAAVRQNGYALRYIEHQTPEICRAAE